MTEEQKDAIQSLKRTGLRTGKTIYTVIKRVSSSGMTRHIGVYFVQDKRIINITWQVAKVLDWKLDRDTGGVVVGGCGMDMGFHTVYSLSRRMFKSGHPHIQKRCPSNDHVNGEHDKKIHRDGGYALRQEWL